MMRENDLPLLQVKDYVELEGVVERIVFHNEENGFTVLRVVPEASGGKRPNARTVDAVPCVGHMLAPRLGARLKLKGHFTNNPRFGRQLAFESAQEVMPATTEDIRHYLGCGLVKGVGPELAARIVAKFGEDTIRVLDEEPERLISIRGVGKKNIEKICNSWSEHRGMRDLHLFLQPYGVGAALAVRIYRTYGEDARAVSRENPYRLAMDIRGIGFPTADGMARKMGFADDHPLRVQAAVLYILQRASEDGHVFLPEDELATLVCKQINVAEDQVDRAVTSLVKEQRLVRELLQSDMAGIYLRRFHHCEARTAFYLRRLMTSPKSVLFGNIDKALNEVVAKSPLRLAAAQVEAARDSASAKALVITGGPGTGKTTIIKAITGMFDSVKAKILMAAPTGRAAKRMAEACGREARTIHRLLEYSPKEDRFTRDEDNPLVCDLLVVDEASMMDTLLFYHLLKAIPIGATLVLVGDVNQLPSVGPGNVLADIIASQAIPVVELNEIFRQSRESEIICNAHMVNRGQLPMLESNPQKLSDFYFIPKEDPEQAAEMMVDLIKNHIPRRFGLDPVDDVQLLTPMHRGATGAESMNSRLQAALNPNAAEVRRGDKAFRLHDKVMQVRNNYDKDIFNGDIGRIVHVDPRERILSVNFDGTVMPYEFEELDDLVPAYAISIHKSQGSEYPAVVIPVMMQHYPLLQRNLVYTGITRGKRLVVLVGERRALQMAIHNNNTRKRHTWLARRLVAQ